MSGPGDPSGKRENEDDEAMPLGFRRSDNGTRDVEFEGLVSKRDGNDNIYIQMIESISPGEMVGQFMNSASPRVQQAVKSTIMGLLGSLRASPQFDASIVTTQRALASLMFQLEMTGYMFRNAEYRVGLQNSLLAASAKTDAAAEESAPGAASPKVSGKITVHLSGQEVQVDASTYVAELAREVEALKSELSAVKEEKDKKQVKDLLAYVQNMENDEMQALTDTISEEVLAAMRQLVDTVVGQMGGGGPPLPGVEVVTEVPAGTLAQLCMWQLVVGYNLREIEARESLNKRLPEA